MGAGAEGGRRVGRGPRGGLGGGVVGVVWGSALRGGAVWGVTF